MCIYLYVYLSIYLYMHIYICIYIYELYWLVFVYIYICSCKITDKLTKLTVKKEAISLKMNRQPSLFCVYMLLHLSLLPANKSKLSLGPCDCHY